MENPGIASHDPHIFHLDAELLGSDLGKHREMALTLAADARGNQHLSARVDRNPRAFIRADTGAFYKTDDPNPHVFALRAQFRQFFFDELHRSR